MIWLMKLQKLVHPLQLLKLYLFLSINVYIILDYHLKSEFVGFDHILTE